MYISIKLPKGESFMIVHKIRGLRLPGRRHISLSNGVQEYLNPKYVYVGNYSNCQIKKIIKLASGK